MTDGSLASNHRAAAQSTRSSSTSTSPTCAIQATQPSTETHFAYQVSAYIAEAGSTGSESFEMVVCSPSWLAGEWGTRREWSNPFLIWDRHPSIVPGNGLWFMDSWDENEVERAIRLISERSSPAPDWTTLANRIGRLIPWEFAGISDDHENRGAGIARTPGVDDVPRKDQG